MTIQTDAPVTPAEAPQAPATPPVEETVDKAKYAALQADARKWEDRAKANATAVKELAALKATSMTDAERLTAEARQSAVAETAAKFGRRLVEAEMRTALSGRHPNIDGLLTGIDIARFISDDGEPDVAAIKSWADSAAAPTTPPPFPDLGQGHRGDPPTGDPSQAFAQFLTGQLHKR